MKIIKRNLLLLLVLCSIFFVNPILVSAKETNIKLIKATSTKYGTIKVTWKNGTKDWDIYAIFRKEKSETTYTLIDFMDAEKTKRQSYIDKSVKANSNYTYTVAGIKKKDLSRMLGSSILMSGYVTKTWTKPKGNIKCYLVYCNDKFIGFINGNQTSVKYYYGRSDIPSTDVYAVPSKIFKDYDKAGSISVKSFSLKTPEITSVSLVGSGKALIKWTRTPAADGYLIYRRTGTKWSGVASVEGENQLYCYDEKVAANTTYYYTVKAYQKADGKQIYSKWNATGKKLLFPM